VPPKYKFCIILKEKEWELVTIYAIQSCLKTGTVRNGVTVEVEDREATDAPKFIFSHHGQFVYATSATLWFVLGISELNVNSLSPVKWPKITLCQHFNRIYI
jgi:hypothetical protein